MTKPTVLRLAGALSAGLVACSIPPSNATIGIVTPSESPTEWEPVADYIGHRCGSLDCHGDVQRNFIVYSCDGLRFAAGDVPGCGMGLTAPRTTTSEYAATYRSLVGLEPAVISEVVASGGQNPDLLTFIRKARGEESHKGGALITPGDDQDLCLTSWLAGATNAAACTQAIDSTQ
jgi:hypothetical protein